MRKMRVGILFAMAMWASAAVHAAVATPSLTFNCGTTLSLTPTGFTIGTATATEATGSRPTSLSLSLPLDAKYPSLQSAAAAGTAFANCTLAGTFVTDAGDFSAKWALTDGVLSSVTLTGTSSSQPTVSAVFTFKSLAISVGD